MVGKRKGIQPGISHLKPKQQLHVQDARSPRKKEVPAEVSHLKPKQQLHVQQTQSPRKKEVPAEISHLKPKQQLHVQQTQSPRKKEVPARNLSSETKATTPHSRKFNNPLKKIFQTSGTSNRTKKTASTPTLIQLQK
ncbi:hypothetical protein L3C95_30970 [Chitinophaga filiformis]|uniref:hypothetical protein n=1 Tax=Chitinophaga filiformis TaxID=104663 RepID=UPI001F1BE505|nr:hypothetical protein [Chitinophaga filiformis]MCF6407357.1 hypothetical protein [Chitinophaga filiformis]